MNHENLQTENAFLRIQINSLNRELASVRFRVVELGRENSKLKTELDLLSVCSAGDAVSFPDLDGPEAILAPLNPFDPAWADGARANP